MLIRKMISHLQSSILKLNDCMTVVSIQDLLQRDQLGARGEGGNQMIEGSVGFLQNLSSSTKGHGKNKSGTIENSEETMPDEYVQHAFGTSRS